MSAEFPNNDPNARISYARDQIAATVGLLTFSRQFSQEGTGLPPQIGSAMESWLLLHTDTISRALAHDALLAAGLKYSKRELKDLATRFDRCAADATRILPPALESDSDETA